MGRLPALGKAEMDTSPVRVFIQARMSSARFPGKVLAPFDGRPMIAHVVSRVARALPLELITVATSTHPTDDPLACYLEHQGVSVHRGSLDDVFGRFQSCLREFPCTWFFRISADSPLLDPGLLERMLTLGDRSVLDLVTNVQKRTFPKGQSVELIRSERFGTIDPAGLSPEEKEHVTQYYYRHPGEFAILNVESDDASQGRLSYVVDTLDDHQRLLELIRRERV
jgi:spore coat polysaccharide biosynthesis protein SpsF